MGMKNVKKIPLNKERLMTALKSRNLSLRDLDRDDNFDGTTKTIGRALSSGLISYTMMCNLSEYLGVEPAYLSGADEREEHTQSSWAEREIEIACAHEREGNETPDGEWDYGCACYQSALKAFKSLCEDGHSGFSIGVTKHILNRLIDGRPLTPIEDTPDVWNHISDISGPNGQEINYQSKRMSSLFKYVYADGSVKYRDIDSCYCVLINNEDVTYTSGLVGRVINEMYPITMPYYPGKPIKVYCEECLTDHKNGDFDTVGIIYAIKDDKRVDINRFFKEGEKDWVEIDLEEYNTRKKLAKDLKTK